MTAELPTYADVVAATERIAPHAQRTPLLESAYLNALTGGRILLKAESLQRVGAFKFRGAYNAVSRVDRERYPGGVVAISSGNHAQGVAEAARILGVRARIVMPADAPVMKVARTRRSGAEVILYDREAEDREAIGQRLCAEHQAALIHPFDDPHVIAGQGTAGLEMMRQAEAIGARVDTVLAPSSGGGLVCGVALAVKHFASDARIYTVEPAGFDDYTRSLASGRRETNPRSSGSICDALMATSPGKITLALGLQLLAGGLTATDDEVRRAVRFCFEELKLVVEPGGAIALACVLEGKLPVAGRTVGIVLSGGNVDPALFSAIIA
jgi:threonine dehydratase